VVTDYLSLYSELSDLLDKKMASEHQCRKFLHYDKVTEYLCTRTPKYIVARTEEDNGFFGRTDFILTVEYFDGESERRSAYIWELKSPKSSLFVKETGHRLRPSADLVSAENQLLHYLYDARRSAAFQQAFGVRDTQIEYGGIVIGIDKNKLAGGAYKGIWPGIYELGYSIRRDAFYTPNNIRLFTWDNIARMLIHGRRL
jgi:Domain of unknown function (DUF4263)